MVSENILIWVGTSMFFVLLFAIQIILLMIIAKKTHAIIEFKASTKGTPIGVFFHDNKYCEWRNTKPEAGMVEDKQYGSFIIDTTYIDKKTKNIMMPFNPSYAMSLNVKSSKMADDFTYVFKKQQERQLFRNGIKRNKIEDTTNIKSLRTSINFSNIKGFVAPILPHNIQSKITNMIHWRVKNINKGSVQNIVLMVIAFIAAVVLGGIVLKVIAL